MKLEDIAAIQEIAEELNSMSQSLKITVELNLMDKSLNKNEKLHETLIFYSGVTKGMSIRLFNLSKKILE